MALLHAELPDGCLVIALPWLQHDAEEVGLIGRIGEMLRLQAETRTTVVFLSTLASEEGELVAAVELYPWLCGQDFQRASAGGFAHQGGAAQFARCAIDNIVMVIAKAKF